MAIVSVTPTLAPPCRRRRPAGAAARHRLPLLPHLPAHHQGDDPFAVAGLHRGQDRFRPHRPLPNQRPRAAGPGLRSLLHSQNRAAQPPGRHPALHAQPVCYHGGSGRGGARLPCRPPALPCPRNRHPRRVQWPIAIRIPSVVFAIPSRPARQPKWT